MDAAEPRMRCPVCRAAVDQGPACRRCKADLSPLFTLERQRAVILAGARTALQEGRWEVAAADSRRASGLRAGPDAQALEAAAHLLRGDFPAAWRSYTAVNPHG